ncbi:MAG: ABC transporter ATP-binding protein, partial [Synechococcaceae bacterium WB4_1_0192]|nr:ABC transporter ATP-binding protein [Synechococcaceae bacterium WB4_1_0192]
WPQIPGFVSAMLPASAYGGVVLLMAGLALLTLVGASANYLHQMVSMGLCARTAAMIRLEVFQHCIHLPLAAVTQQGPTEFTSRVLRDTGELRAGFESLTSKTIAQITKGVAAFLAALLFDWRLVLERWPLVLLLLTLPVLFKLALVAALARVPAKAKEAGEAKRNQLIAAMSFERDSNRQRQRCRTDHTGQDGSRSQ